MWQATSKNTKIIFIALFALVAILLFSSLEKSPELIGQKKAISLLENSKIKKVLVKNPYVYLYLEEKIYKVPKEAIEKEKLFSFGKIEYYEESTELMDSIIFVILLLTMAYVFYIMRASRKTQEEFVSRQQVEMADSKIEKQIIQAQHSKVTFADVAGVEGVKEELEEVIDFLRNPEKYREFDISLPKGVLLVGPPGVGKTLIAKAVAGEANVPFFYQSAASFVQIYVGMGAKRVSELFAKAKEMAPSIIL